MTPRPRPPAVRLLFGAAGLCLAVAVLLCVWDAYARA